MIISINNEVEVMHDEELTPTQLQTKERMGQVLSLMGKEKEIVWVKPTSPIVAQQLGMGYCIDKVQPVLVEIKDGKVVDANLYGWAYQITEWIFERVPNKRKK